MNKKLKKEIKSKKEKKLTIPGYTHISCSYIRLSDIPEKYRDEFLNWLSGQTRPLPIESKYPRTKFQIFMYKFFGFLKGTIIEDAVYVEDWHRWYNMKENKIPTYFD